LIYTTFRIAQTMFTLGRARFDQRSRKAPIHYRRMGARRVGFAQWTENGIFVGRFWLDC